MMLSILIPTIPERFNQFQSLFRSLDSQIEYCDDYHSTLGEVEILYDDSPSVLNGGISVGKKRNGLVKKATGKYLCFLDDDDKIAPNYVETLLRLCREDKDVCTFNALFKCDTYWSLIDMSINHEINEQAAPDIIVKRKAWHICPVRSEYAKQFEFEDKNNAEDWGWFSKVSTLIHTEEKSNKILYQYNHSSTGSMVDQIERQ